MCVEASSITCDTSSAECSNIFHVSVQKVTTRARPSPLPEGRSATALCHGLRAFSIDDVSGIGAVTILSCLVDMLTVKIIPVQVMKAYRGTGGMVPLISALDGGERSVSLSGRFNPERDQCIPLFVPCYEI